MLRVVREWVGSLEGVGGAGDGTGVVGVNQGEVIAENIKEASWGLVIIQVSASEVNVTVAEAVIAFIGTSGGLVWWLDFAEALLVEAWHRVSSELNG